MEIHLNDIAIVRLTDVGKEILKRLGHQVPNQDDDGWSRRTLWDLMHTLGPYISIEKEPPLEATIRIIHYPRLNISTPPIPEG